MMNEQCVMAAKIVVFGLKRLGDAKCTGRVKEACCGVLHSACVCSNGAFVALREYEKMRLRRNSVLVCSGKGIFLLVRPPRAAVCCTICHCFAAMSHQCRSIVGLRRGCVLAPKRTFEFDVVGFAKSRPGTQFVIFLLLRHPVCKTLSLRGFVGT